MSDEKKRSKFGKGCLIVIGVLIVLVVIGAIVGGDEKKGAGPSETTKGAEATPAQTVSAKEISAAFQENEVKAKKDYGDKRLQVTGKIKDIQLDFADNPVIKLIGANEQMNMGLNKDGKMTDVSVSGLPADVSADLKKGDGLTVVCSAVNEVLGGAQLSECAVAEAAPTKK